MAIDVLESSVELSFELTLLIQVSLSSTVANCWPRPCLAKSSERRCSHAFSLHRKYTTQTSTHSIYAQYVCTARTPSACTEHTPPKHPHTVCMYSTCVLLARLQPAQNIHHPNIHTQYVCTVRVYYNIQWPRIQGLTDQQAPHLILSCSSSAFCWE